MQPLHSWATARLDLASIPDLKAEAKAQGVKVSGTRQELIDRLRTLTTQAPKTEAIALNFVPNIFALQNLTRDEYNTLIRQIMTPGTIPQISELPPAPLPKVEDPLLRLTRDQLLAEIKLHPNMEKQGIKEVLVDRIRQMREPALTEPVRAILNPQPIQAEPQQPQIEPDVDPLESLTVLQLKDELKAQGLKVSGTKAELIQRIRNMPGPAITPSIQQVIAQPRIPRTQMGRWIVTGGQIQNLPPGQTLPPAQIYVIPPITVPEMKRDPLDRLTIAQLKDELRVQPGQKLGGTKAELIQRVRNMPGPAMTEPVQAILGPHH